MTSEKLLVGEGVRSAMWAQVLRDRFYDGKGGSGNRDEAIELFNEARTAGREDRLQCLAHVQELVLHKEPALLEEFVPAFLELEPDQLAVVRKALVGFIDDVIKQFPQYLPQSMQALIRLCDDPSPLVLKRLVLAATSSIFRQGLTLITSPHSPLTPQEKSALWDALKSFRAALSAQLRKQPGHEGVRAPTAKLLETLCLAFLVPDPGAPTSPPALFNAAQADAALQAELANEARACLTALIEALQPGAVATATAVVVVGALTAVVRARQACRDIGVQALVAFAQSVAAAPLSASQATSLQHTLKANFAALLKQRVLEGSPLQSQVRDILANIGARDQFEALKRHSESAAMRAAASAEDDGAPINSEGAVKKPRRETPADAYNPATYESIDDALVPQEGDQVPVPVAGMPSYAELASLGAEVLAELVLEVFKKVQLPVHDTALTSTALSLLVERLTTVTAHMPTPAPALRAAPIAQAAFRDLRRDPRLRDQPATSSETPTAAPAVDTAQLLAQQLAAAMAAAGTLQPVALPVLPAPSPVKQPMTLLPPTPLPAEQISSLAKRVFERLLSAEASARNAGKAHERAVLIARLVARRPVDDPLIQTLLDHVTTDLAQRAELAQIWLTHEARSNESERYSTLCAAFIQKAVAALPPKEKLIVRVCSELPLVPSSVLSVLGALALDPERSAVIVATLRQVLLLYPRARSRALDLILHAALHADEAVRNAAIRAVATQLYLVKAAKAAAKKEEDKDKEKEAELDRIAARVSPALSVRIEEFALAALSEALTAADAPAADVVMTDKTDAKPAARDDTNKANATPATSGGSAETKSASTTTSTETANAAPALTEEEEAVKRRVALYFALVPRKGELLAELIPLYGRSKAATQVLRRLLPAAVRALPANSPALLALLADPPRKAHPLIWQVLHTGTESAPPNAEIRTAAQSLFKRYDDPRFIVCTLNALPKEQCIALLPKFVFFHDTDEETKADPKALLTAAFTRMLVPVGAAPNVHPAPLTPAELLIALHTMQIPATKEGAPPSIKQVADAIYLCLEMKGMFKQEVLAVVLQQLVDITPTPRYLMYTVLQTVQRFSSLVSSGFITSILSHLVRHRVWQDSTLWTGVIKCCKLLAPRSFSVLLQMPEAQLADVLSKSPELKEPLQKYASTNVKNVPKPLQKVLGIDPDAKKKTA